MTGQFSKAINNEAQSLLSQTSVNLPDLRITPITSAESAHHLSKACLVAEKLKTRTPFSIHPFRRIPIQNCEKRKDLTNPEQKFAKFLSFERFTSALRKSFSSTLSSIKNEPYIILADHVGKSTNWGTSLVLDLMESNLPAAIISR
ncbi:MAG: hypothetical protein JSS09_00110, partial [Verrucomicrobia bacterium]|nr:hypothetical protein [Verrucomicrobiota bacterium]